jgi:hypothetical protein
MTRKRKYDPALGGILGLGSPCPDSMPATAARAASGQAAAMPPRVKMNARLSFDHLVGKSEQCWRNVDAERLCRL